MRVGDWVRLAGFPDDLGGRIVGPVSGWGDASNPAWLVESLAIGLVPWYENELELVSTAGEPRPIR